MIRKGTRVVVYSKSTGCSLEELLDRGIGYPNSTPFTGWIADTHRSGGHTVYTIVYEQFRASGDYYLQGDFENDEYKEMFSDEEFLL